MNTRVNGQSNDIIFSTCPGNSAKEPGLLIWVSNVNFSAKANYQTQGTQIVRLFIIFWGNICENQQNEQNKNKQVLEYPTLTSQSLLHLKTFCHGHCHI